MSKHISKFILGIAIIFLTPSHASAQEDTFKNSSSQERAQLQTEWMRSELNLDSTILPVVYNINLKYSKKTQLLRNTAGSRIQKYRDFKVLSDAKDSELRKIFTKEQYRLYQLKKEGMKQNMKQKIQENRNKFH
jgi:hypothetical protein